MKTPASSGPRFVCRVARGWTSWYDDATTGEARGLGARHIASCEDCRRFRSACNQLEMTLKLDAARETDFVPSGLNQRIIYAVNHSGAKPRTHKTRTVSFALTGAAICLVLTLLLFRRPHGALREAPVATPVLATNDGWVSLKPSADALLSGDPLQQEVAAVVSDVQSAFRFLQGSFLPAPPEKINRRG